VVLFQIAEVHHDFIGVGGFQVRLTEVAKWLGEGRVVKSKLEKQDVAFHGTPSGQNPPWIVWIFVTRWVSGKPLSI